MLGYLPFYFCSRVADRIGSDRRQSASRLNLLCVVIFGVVSIPVYVGTAGVELDSDEV